MGRPGPDRKVTTDEVLAIFRDLDDPCRPLTRSDIAEKLDCSPPTAGKRLTELVEDGKLQTRKVGAKGRVWWRSVNKY
jgi:predicted ArsR family transcriptional regulator